MKSTDGPHDSPMHARLRFEILPQPSKTTCGPTALHAVYNYYDDPISLTDVVDQTASLEEGGTLGVMLGLHALGRGYKVTIYTFNLHVFDPTWFPGSKPLFLDKLQRQMHSKQDPKLHTASLAYQEFFRRGGRLDMQDLTSELIRKYLTRSIPILTGLSATYLYQERRELGTDCNEDDVQGYPSGHFVVLCGYDKARRLTYVADPLSPNPFSSDQQLYAVSMDRLKCAILLGILTYDANLLIIEPAEPRPGARHVDPHRHQ